MSDIDKLTEDGFSLSATSKTLSDVALLSLRVGLRSYFSTYSSVRGHLADLAKEFGGLSADEQTAFVDSRHNADYCEAYSQAVIHLHHFVELTIKELLRREHPLLAVDASGQHEILCDLLKRRSVGPEKQEKLKSLEFAQALERLVALVKANKIAGAKRLKFIVDAKATLDRLNKLRNRLAHRGTFVLRYKALDLFVSRHILPIIQRCLRLAIYARTPFVWRYRHLHRSIDPLGRIIKEGARPQPSFTQLALLKEMGRAAYANPLLRGPSRRQRGTRIFDRREEEAAKLAVEAVKDQEQTEATEIRVCPVCGVHSLVIFGYWQMDGYPVSEDGQDYEIEYEYVRYSAVCHCCTFHVQNEIDPVSFSGLSMSSYW